MSATSSSSVRWAPAVLATLAGFATAAGAIEAPFADASAGVEVPAMTAPPTVAEIAVATAAQQSAETKVADEDSGSMRWSSSAELSGGSYRWTLSRGPFDMGMSFDAPGRTGRAFDFRSAPAGPVVSVLPSFSLGLRRASPPAPAGTLLERSSPSRTETYVSKLAVEWKPAESQVNFLREGLGIRLDGSDRMTVRLRKGVLGIYMHHKF